MFDLIKGLTGFISFPHQVNPYQERSADVIPLILRKFYYYLKTHFFRKRLHHVKKNILSGNDFQLREMGSCLEQYATGQWKHLS